MKKKQAKIISKKKKILKQNKKNKKNKKKFNKKNKKTKILLTKNVIIILMCNLKKNL